jgi:hypothetical protein
MENRGDDLVIEDECDFFFEIFVGLLMSDLCKRGEDRVGPVTTLSLSNSVTEESLELLILITLILLIILF